MKYPGLRDWEWMIRTAAQPDMPEDPYDQFSDIWQGHSGRGADNAAAQQWLDDRVQYDRPDTAYPERLQSHQWTGRPLADLPYDVQEREAGRDIDGNHAAFQEALHRGLSGEDYSGPGMFNPGGQAEPEEWNPTSQERLNSDEGWLLGPSKQFNWPGGREKYESIHNGMHERGFDLHNVGSEEEPVPGYIHRDTYARIIPGFGADGEPNWHMNSPGPGGVTEHAGPSSAAATHQQKMEERNAAEAARYQQQSHRQRSPEEYYDYDTSGRRQRTRSPREPRRPASPDYIPKSKAQSLHWRELFSHAVHGNDGNGKGFERASVKSVLNPHRGDTGRLYGVHRDQWNEDFENDRQGKGKVAQAIYHYATPIAWKYHSAQPDGTYDEGTWRQPATSFGSGGFFSTGRVQGLMSGAFHGTNHEYLRDPLISHHTHRAMEEAGIHRQDDQTYKSVDAFGNTHHLAPSQSGQTMVHTITSQDGNSQWKRRLPSGEAAENAYTMTQAPGAGGPSDAASFLKEKKYKGFGEAAPKPARRREVPLRIQPELPGMPRMSMVNWAEALRG